MGFVWRAESASETPPTDHWHSAFFAGNHHTGSISAYRDATHPDWAIYAG
ncbi:hypothetical protein PLANPX_2243 [Lacipirellula parvula]|uniref:Uncharacterized protein n=1 Tax=Lacipirellula parvula TaxID=2650471 RepID=A0A5K7XCT2_9BACT|nr:hypothetical protein PLANPX_2243 [Lacipirellula parvula]